MKKFLMRLFGLMRDRPSPPGSSPPSTDSDVDSEGPSPDVHVVTDFLDLHGFWPEQVAEVVEEFLRSAAELGISEVRIAHGKGKSVLKRHVIETLRGHPDVIDFGDAPPERGGWGSTIVRLRRSPWEEDEGGGGS